MPWPSDPARRAEAVERAREAQRARWTPERRAEAASIARIRQSTPEFRARMRDVKNRQYAERPDIKAKISATLRGRANPCTPARQGGLLRAWERRRADSLAREEAKRSRLQLLRERAACVIGSPHGAPTS